jgi:hypothetical protein
VTRAALPHCTGPCHQGRAACTWSTGRAPQPAEACTELGADTAPTPPSLWRRLQIARLRYAIACLKAERDHYRGLGWVGPIYLRESYAQQHRLMARITRLQAVPAGRGRAPAWRRTLATALVAVSGAAGLVLAACGGGGTDEEPAPRPQVDCDKTPEQCK